MNYSRYKSSAELKRALVKAKRKSSSGRIGFTIEEVDMLMKMYIQESAERLRKRLRAKWKKNARLERIRFKSKIKS